jgi:predicted aconitase with swiveling domain
VSAGEIENYFDCQQVPRRAGCCAICFQSGCTPKAPILKFANPIMAQGAAFADLPLIDRFEVDITTAIKSGEMVTVDPEAGTLTVHASG